MAVRAKFRVDAITDNGGYKQLQLFAVADDGTPENERYHKYTPCGSISISIDNPAASEQFEVGKSYYVDFTLAPQ